MCVYKGRKRVEERTGRRCTKKILVRSVCDARCFFFYLFETPRQEKFGGLDVLDDRCPQRIVRNGFVFWTLKNF